MLDSGVQADLPDLRGRVVPGGDLLGGGTNGLRDLDPRAHGTRIAGLIVGQGTRTGMVGIAPEAQVLSIRMYNDTNSSSSDRNMAMAIRSAVRQGASVINISLAVESESGLVCDPERQAAIDFALAHNAIVVAGAGNNIHERNVALQPASCPGVLAVGSVDRHGAPDHYSQPQSYVSVAAPGVQLSSVESNRIDGSGVFVRDLRGTSYAAALVSGVVALLRSKYPNMPVREVLRRVTTTARDIRPKERDSKTGYGVVQPYEALTAVIPAGASSPVYEQWEQSRRGRALQPLPAQTGEEIPDPVPFRTKVVRAGLVTAFLVGLCVTVTGAFIVWRRRRRADASRSETPRLPDPLDGRR